MWHSLVREEGERRLCVNGEQPSSVLAYRIGDGRTLAAYRLCYWESDPTRAELYLWSSALARAVLPDCIAQAAALGVRAIEVLAYGDVAQSVSALCGEPDEQTDQVFIYGGN